MFCKNCNQTVSILEDVCPHCNHDLRKVDVSRTYVGRTSSQGSSSAAPDASAISVSRDGKPFGQADQEGHWPGIAVFQDVSMADVKVEVFHWKKLNWSLINCQVPFIQKLKITNNSKANITDLIVRIKIAPDYGDSWEQTVKSIPPKQPHVVEGINLPLSRERLLAVKEAEQAFLKTQVNAQGRDIDLKTEPIEVLAYNEWYFNPFISESLAGFILPNSNAVNEVIMHAAEALAELGLGTAFDGYQSNDAGKIIGMANALYLVLQNELGIKYINPPTSFEATGQKILKHDDILKIGHGTCLDLALFYAACLERVGLHPLIFIVSGHAFLGIWLNDEAFCAFQEREQKYYDKVRKKMAKSEFSAQEKYKEYILEKLERYARVIAQGEFILPLNSTTFTTDGDFDICGKEAMIIFAKHDLMAVVDISAVRDRVRPLPLQ